MKKINKKHTVRRRPVLVIVAILLIAVVGLIIAKVLTNQAAQNNAQNEGQSTEQDYSDDTADESTASTETLGESTSSYDDPTGQTPVQYEGTNANESPSYTGAITYTGVSGSNLTIRVNIDQSISSGTCSLKMTNGAHEYSESAPVILNASTSSCEGFDISTTELSSGTWSIEITINSNDKSGTITGSVNI